MLELFDTHCHIQSAGLKVGERSTRELWAKAPELTGDQLVANAAEAGVTGLICVGCDHEDSQLAIDFAKTRDICWASVGIHPHEAQHYAGNADKQAKFASLAVQHKVVAVGECGLDYYYEHSPKAAQIELLKFQIELALKHDLPLIFHVREAFDDFWPIFDSYAGIRGVLHSFTDTAENLAKAMERGLYIGVNGIATFAKDPAQIEVYRTIPLQKLLLETDAPFLTPTPYRGTINESKRVGTIAEFMANLRRDENLENLAATTTSNARALFGI
ncbi:MAG: Preprotein translocase [Candidatus Saccharibacteria bacterium]|nr:Preprotein translocase [Candidatus Saccharibacteria bacterium]